MAASTGTTPPLKAISAGNLNTTPPKPVASNVVLNFSVMDLHGVLLTCAKQQVDTDTFSGCTLAPGRTLDELMTSIVQTIHAEQKKDNAE
jgi:predicted Na+-dependent transporter